MGALRGFLSMGRGSESTAARAGVPARVGFPTTAAVERAPEPVVRQATARPVVTRAGGADADQLDPVTRAGRPMHGGVTYFDVPAYDPIAPQGNDGRRALVKVVGSTGRPSSQPSGWVAPFVSGSLPSTTGWGPGLPFGGAQPPQPNTPTPPAVDGIYSGTGVGKAGAPCHSA